MESKQTKRLKLVLAVVLALDLLLVAAHLNPPNLAVEQATYQSSPGRAPSAGEQPGVPQLPGFFAGIFRIEIPKRVVGQELHFDRVEFFQREGQTLATMPIQYIQRFVRIETIPAGGGPPQISETSETISGSLWLYPFEDAKVSLGVGVSKVLKIDRRRPLMARIHGESGFRKFEVVAKVTSTPLGVPPPGSVVPGNP